MAVITRRGSEFHRYQLSNPVPLALLGLDCLICPPCPVDVSLKSACVDRKLCFWTANQCTRIGLREARASTPGTPPSLPPTAPSSALCLPGNVVRGRPKLLETPGSLPCPPRSHLGTRCLSLQLFFFFSDPEFKRTTNLGAMALGKQKSAGSFLLARWGPAGHGPPSRLV